MRIVRGAHNVAFEFVAQNARVAALGAPQHRLADKRKHLVAIQAAEFENIAVQLETMIGEFRFAKANGAAVLIDKLITAQKAHMNGIKMGL